MKCVSSVAVVGVRSQFLATRMIASGPHMPTRLKHDAAPDSGPSRISASYIRVQSGGTALPANLLVAPPGADLGKHYVKVKESVSDGPIVVVGNFYDTVKLVDHPGVSLRSGLSVV